MPSIFTLFAVSSNSFKGQLPNENVILLKRRHWIFLAINILILLLFCFLPVLIYIFLNTYAWFSQAINLFWFLASGYYLFLWFLLFYNITMYLLNVFILTNQRIVKINQLGFFNYKTAELDLSKIQDVAIKQKGVFSNLFNYGDLEIQTAGTQNKFLFVRLPNPENLKQAIITAKP